MRPVARGLAVSCLALVLWHCGSSATGVEACRTLEARKCELVVGCPGATVADAGDVEACKLFYRDQCLHGMADGADPDDAAVNGCLAALDKAATCRATKLSACTGAPPLAAGADATKLTGCDALLATESLAACSFLGPVAGTGGAGGEASTSSGDGGSGGTGGS